MNDQQLAALKARVMRVSRPESALLTYFVLLSLASVCAAPVVLVPLLFRYYTLWYRFDDSGVAMGYGVLFRREMQLTYARMQDIHVSQNLLERWLGIGTVTVQTAGAQGNLTLVGVRDIEAVRDFLYARMRGIRPAVAEPEAGAPSTEVVLTQIRDALVQAAQALEARR
jgi:uncharacterized protein